VKAKIISGEILNDGLRDPFKGVLSISLAFPFFIAFINFWCSIQKRL
jgi:hypothetical protein